jgi:CHAT domain-containing protein
MQNLERRKRQRPSGCGSGRLSEQSDDAIPKGTLWFVGGGEAMRSFIIPIGVLLLTGIVQPLPDASAHRWEADADTRDKLSREFQRLIELGQNAGDPEEQIAALNAALRLESGFGQWPLRTSRAEIKGTILGCLGNSYHSREQGKRADNLEEAIKAYEAALTLLTRQALPQQWATAQHNLGNAYNDRIRGYKADNVELAIQAYQAALTVYTRKGFPKDWAMVQNALANAYTDRVRGSKAENMEVAIQGYRAALTVRTREALPQDWGHTLGNLASAYRQRIKGSKAENVELAIEASKATLTVLSLDTFPQDWAMAQNNLGNAYTDRIKGSKADNLELAIEAFEEALTVRTREDFPEQWAQTQINLASAYNDRIKGSRADNLEAAIKSSDAALTILTREAFPQQWATAQNNLVDAYRNRIKGEKADNLEVAIKAAEAALTVRTREAFPEDWATTQNNLAIVYHDRIKGSRADNLEVTIKAYEAALTIKTREAFPEDWAEAQSNLASAYLDRIIGSRTDNLEAAIKACEAALTVRTREAFPENWAQTQNNLAIAYSNRIKGSKTPNLEAAITAYHSALTVLTREAFPRDWARIQQNLGSAYCDCNKGSKLNNPETAIEAYRAALTVFTPDAFPQDWAGVQYNLANAYRDRIKGAKAKNMETAIEAYRAALTIFTRDAFPRIWAGVQNNLANTYRDRIEGARAENLGAAVRGYEAALTVYTRDAFPRDHLRVTRVLGQSLLDTRDWRPASAAYANARDAFLLLFGEGLEEAEAQDLIAEAGPLFAESAYTAAEMGDLPGALNLLSQGKARLMAISLRQQSLDLPVEKAAQLTEFKTEIREWARRAEINGDEGAQALQHVVRLRQSLAALLKDAFAKQAPTVGAMALARSALPEGGVIAAPIVTKAGGKVLIIAGSRDAPALSMLDLPELTTIRLNEFVKGPADAPKVGGWLGAFNIQYLPEPERSQRNPEWLAAIENIGFGLGKLFVGALAKDLAERNLKPGARLIILPTGTLGLLPLGLAQDTATGSRLGDAYEVAEAPSLEALAVVAGRTGAPEALSLTAAVNPTGLIPRLALPFTETEGILVAAHFNSAATVMLDKFNASPGLTLEALKNKSYWHFSSHGFFDWDDARASGLLMKDEQKLTVGRLLDMRGALGKPRLVVLSACETGIYDAERNPDEFVGLPATFMELGAAGVLGTLWQVDDMATALLMAKFYDLHIDERLSPAAALKAAQAWLRSARRDDLMAYAEKQAQDGRLDPVRLAELETLLQTRRRSPDSHFASTWNILQERGDAAGGRSDASSSNAAADPGSKPFAHPYYWAAFVYTGL